MEGPVFSRKDSNREKICSFKNYRLYFFPKNYFKRQIRLFMGSSGMEKIKLNAML